MSEKTDKWMGAITPYEAAQIWKRLHQCCPLNQQVLWSGVKYKAAQQWARDRDMQTLSIAMGQLMDTNYSYCRLNFRLNQHQRSNYVHAASIIFAIYITTGTRVTLLTPPPPRRFRPSGQSYYQNVEEPWIMACCDKRIFQIRMVHPDMPGAESSSYQYWPQDEKHVWAESFAGLNEEEPKWPHSSSKKGPCSIDKFYESLVEQRNILIRKMELYETGRPVYWPTVVSLGYSGA